MTTMRVATDYTPGHPGLDITKGPAMSTRESREHDAQAEATREVAHQQRMRDTPHRYVKGDWPYACGECSDTENASQHREVR